MDDNWVWNTKPRDEIAQVNVDDREREIDLDALSKRPISELAQGDIVLYEGLWVKIAEWVQVGGEYAWIRLRFTPLDGPSLLGDRRVIAMPNEEFYVRENSTPS